MSRRRAVLGRCSRCGAPTWSGVDADRVGLPVEVDDTPLTREQELAAVVLGIAVYDLDADQRLHDRKPAAVVHGPSRWPLPAHQCGRVLAGHRRVRPGYRVPDSPAF